MRFQLAHNGERAFTPAQPMNRDSFSRQQPIPVVAGGRQLQTGDN